MIYLLLFLPTLLLARDSSILGTNVPAIMCITNASLPPFQPNMYLCANTSSCCVTRLQPACCEKDVSAKQLFRQSIPFVILFVFFLLIALVISWYLNDDEVVEESGDEDAFKRKTDYKNLLFPSEGQLVDDPVFGRVWDEKAPRYSRLVERQKTVGYLVEETKKTA